MMAAVRSVKEILLQAILFAERLEFGEKFRNTDVGKYSFV